MAAKLLMLFVLVSGIAQDDSHRTKQIFNIICDRNSHEDCQGETLETAAAKVREQTDVRIDIKTHYLQLSANVTFTNLSSLTINGIASLTTINCISHLSAGIVLSNIEKVTLNNLSLIFCGAVINRKVNNKIYSSALTIFHCKNVQLNRLVIVRSRGIGLIVSNYEDGEVNIKSAVFKENTQPKEHIQQSIMGGGGVYIIVSQQNLSDQHTLYHFDNCTFENNSAHTDYHKLYHTLNNEGTQLEGYGQGGGMSVAIKSGTSNVTVSLINCKFVANNVFFGGGLYVSISGSNNLVTRNVSVELRDSFFEGNGGNCNTNQTFGGGADLNFDTVSDKPILDTIINSQYLVRNVTFVNNCAIVGGGVYYFSDPGPIDSSNSIIFDNCSWQGNQGHLGSAFAMIPNYFLKLFKGYTTNPVFCDCLFLGNEVFSNHSHTHN